MVKKATHKKIEIQSRYKMFCFDVVSELAKPHSERWYRMNLILTKAYQKGLLYASREQDGNKEGYVYFSYKEARLLGGYRYKEVFAQLEQAGILVKRGFRSFKNGSQDIRAYRYLEITPSFVDYRVNHKRIENALNSYYTAKAKAYSPVVRNKLIPNLRKIKIVITEQQFWAAVDGNYENYRLQRIRNKRVPLPIEAYRKEYEVLWAEIQSWNTTSGNEFFRHVTEDSFSGRVHTTITTLPKFIRELGVLEYKGEPLAELDIKTFQPMLLALLLDGTDYSRWFFSTDDCYKEIQKMFNLISRDEAKTYMYKWMFGTAYGKHHKQFCKMFPEAGSQLTRLKKTYNPDNPNSYKAGKGGKKVKNYHSNTAFLMQKREVSVMRQVWAVIYRRHIPFATIHDAVLVTESRLDEAYNIMINMLQHHLKPAAGKIVVKKSAYNQKAFAA